MRRGHIHWGAAAAFLADIEPSLHRLGALQQGLYIAGERGGAATITCEFPGGPKVVGNSIFELRDGLIVREHDVAAGD